jgi:hypothetical protein
MFVVSCGLFKNASEIFGIKFEKRMDLLLDLPFNCLLCSLITLQYVQRPFLLGVLTFERHSAHNCPIIRWLFRCCWTSEFGQKLVYLSGEKTILLRILGCPELTPIIRSSPIEEQQHGISLSILTFWRSVRLTCVISPPSEGNPQDKITPSSTIEEWWR